MFGREYSNYPELLMQSFGQMKEDYKKKLKKDQGSKSKLQKIYLSIFGIPEIGFQLRSLYFKKTILSTFKRNKPKIILDAGSGIGAYSIWLCKNFQSAEVHGWEIDKTKLDFTKKIGEQFNLKNLSFKKEDIVKKRNGKNKYGLIINIDVLEHVKNYKKVLKNFYQLLVPGGYLYLHVPQLNQKRIFKSLKKWTHEDHKHEGFSPLELKQDLQSLGFKIVAIKETFGFFGKLSWEINHIALSKNFLLAGFIYPLLYLIAKLDLLFENKNGLGVSIIVRKK